MTWKAATDTAATNIARTTNFRVRFQVYNNGAAAKSWQPQLEWSATSGSGYAAVPTASGAPPFYVTDTGQFLNGDAIATATFALGTGTGATQAGVAYDTQNPPAAISLTNGNYTEIEFNIQANANAAYSTSYYFRLTNAGTAFDAYDITEAIITMQAAPAGPLPLHATDVVVGSTTYNTVNSNPLAGTLTTASAAISSTGVKTLADAAAISIFASNAVPSGFQWDLGVCPLSPQLLASASRRRL